MAGIFSHHNVTAPPIVRLGTGSNFAIIAGSGITIAGAVHSTTITGDIGTFPNTSIIGLGNAILHGINHAGDAVTQNAKNDLITAYNDAAGRTTNTTAVNNLNLTKRILFSGIYSNANSLFLSGALTLNALGNPDAVWVFRVRSTLVTASNSKVILINGAQACNVFWQVGNSVTLGTGSDFAGNILTLNSITLNAGARVNGRIFARNGTVTLNANSISQFTTWVPDYTYILARSVYNTVGVPDHASTLILLTLGLLTLMLARLIQINHNYSS